MPFKCKFWLKKEKQPAFTLIELLVSLSILAIFLSGLFSVFNFTQSHSPSEAARVSALSKARVVSSRLSGDLRNSVVWDIANNDPSCSYIKFRQIQGIDTEDGTYDFVSQHIEYSYDQESRELTRTKLDSEGEIISEIVFPGISSEIFYTLNSEGEKVCLNGSDLLSQGFIIIEVKAKESGRRNLPVYSNLTRKIKLRNE